MPSSKTSSWRWPLPSSATLTPDGWSGCAGPYSNSTTSAACSISRSPAAEFVSSDDAADHPAGEPRLQPLVHGVGALPPGELATAQLSLHTELLAQHVVAEQLF